MGSERESSRRTKSGAVYLDPDQTSLDSQQPVAHVVPAESDANTFIVPDLTPSHFAHRRLSIDLAVCLTASPINPQNLKIGNTDMPDGFQFANGSKVRIISSADIAPSNTPLDNYR